MHDQGGDVLAGRCDEDLGVPYQPFVEALRHFVDHTPSRRLTERLGRYGGELARLVPELAARVPELPPPSAPTRRPSATGCSTRWPPGWRRLPPRQPVLLVLDDLQWAAKPTLLLLRHVVRSAGARAAPRSLAPTGTRNSTHDHPLVELLADLRRQAGVERLSLPVSTTRGVAAFVERAAGQALDDEGLALARAIHAETEGNPFFVREVLRHLAETGVIAAGRGRDHPAAHR